MSAAHPASIVVVISDSDVHYNGHTTPVPCLTHLNLVVPRPCRALRTPASSQQARLATLSFPQVSRPCKHAHASRFVSSLAVTNTTEIPPAGSSLTQIDVHLVQRSLGVIAVRLDQRISPALHLSPSPRHPGMVEWALGSQASMQKLDLDPCVLTERGGSGAPRFRFPVLCRSALSGVAALTAPGDPSLAAWL